MSEPLTQQDWFIIEDGGPFAVSMVEQLIKRLCPCWTTDKPTKPGFYWFRETNGEERYMVKVYNDGTMWRSHYIEEEKMTEGQWAGPLEPPV